MRLHIPSLLASTVALGLGLSACTKPYDDSADVKAREAFAKKAVFEEDAGRMWNVASTSEVQFEQDFSIIMYDPPDDFRAHAVRWMGQNAHVRLKTHGPKKMKLVIKGWVNEKVLRTHPVITLYIDGQYLPYYYPAKVEAIKDHYWIEAEVPARMLQREWVDLNIRLNSIGWHWSEPPNLQVAVLYGFSWEEAP